jgi:DNA-binding LytR/AlgR family response regulator
MSRPSSRAQASRIGPRAHLVFVTAYYQYAVQAFEQRATDYLVKPLEPAEALIRTPLKELVDQLDAAHPCRCTAPWW